MAAAFLAAANTFAAWYVGREQAVYYHDYAFYWTRSADLADALRTDPPAAWDRVRQSAHRDDYGLTAAAGPAAVMAVAGTGRLPYVLAVVALYLGAVAAAGWAFVRRFAPNSGRLAAVVPAVLVLTCPAAWTPVLRGYLDAGGAALTTLAAAVFLSRPAGELRARHLLLTAALLAAAVLFRRWYGYFAVALVFAAGVEAVVTRRRAAVRAVLVVAVGILVLVGSFAAPWVTRVAAADLTADMAAWRSADPLLDRVAEGVDLLGPGSVAVAAVGFVMCAAVRDLRRPAVYLAGTCPVMAWLFLRVQNLYPHHLYLFLPAIVLLPAVALARVLTPAPGWVRGLAVAAVAAAGAVTMAAAFDPDAADLRERVRPLVRRDPVYPLVRDDLPELRRLLRFLDREAGPGGRVVVLSSGTRFNPDTVANAGRSLGEDLPGPGLFLTAPEVDRAGGFPVGVFAADLIVVADPVQTHLPAGEQQVVIVTHGLLFQREGIGRAFDRLPERFHFPTHGVSVFHRARAVPAADLDAFAAALREAHPDRPALFTPPADLARLLDAPPGR